MRTKKAAFEMSVGTIVTIVLSVTLLVLGIFFVQQVFNSAKGVVDLTDTQLRNEVNKLFSDEDKISIYPSTRLVEIKQEKTDQVAVGIQNLLTGASASTSFSYEVTADDSASLERCGISQEEAEDWIVTGRTGKMNIPVGEVSVQRITFEIPSNTPLCTIRFGVNIFVEEEIYAPTDSFDIKVKAK